MKLTIWPGWTLNTPQEEALAKAERLHKLQHTPGVDFHGYIHRRKTALEKLKGGLDESKSEKGK